jgi:ATP-dependent exoDNAse (exonuclease V) alpha subunit
VLIAKGLTETSKEGFYVSASRARKQVAVYATDKEALRDAIEQSDH